ncbi:MAG TPA: APC family permease [Stellaceae bacterium]|nr:APC family permease [Stellaceae bacterium]
MRFSLVNLLLGRPVANAQAQSRSLTVFEGVPAMGLDGIGSASYGPEAALSILVAAGSAGLHALGPIMAVIIALLATLWFSYWQTISAYPGNGSSYIVARENLGPVAGLVAASALMVDYVLNVAVGISAGVGALISAIPVLQSHILLLCLSILAIITLVNLRGTRESGLAWSVPTYSMIVCLGGLLLWGTAKILASGDVQPLIPPPAIPKATEALSWWLILRAFASGCTAMTGVEAVSNGVTAFREPRQRYAHGTLSVIVLVLGFLLGGIAITAHAFGVMAMDQSQPGYQSVLSQLVAALCGRGGLYYVTIGSILAVLCLSANTSFVDFPRMCHLVARDGNLPRPFAVPGRRLVYSVGILFLAVSCGALLTVFGGITDRLIPLFAVGAFLAFTMSQAGMAAHWWRKRSKERSGTTLAKLLINGTGACITGAALIIIVTAKFTEGAWITVIVIPLTILALLAIGRYYRALDNQLLSGDPVFALPSQVAPRILVPIQRWDRVTAKALRYAIALSDDVTVIHVTRLGGPDDHEDNEKLRRDWDRFVGRSMRAERRPMPDFRIMRSEYRSIVAPTLRVIEEGRPDHPVIVVLPELIEGSWWERLFHVHRERRLRARLLRYGDRPLAVLGVPWQLRAQTLQEQLMEEEPPLAVPTTAEE